ncbi:hypothetical protein [Mycobacterium stomatepiae]|uniref:hypothetical protein n=1 Tax=Mycobacterium stomatepiae TaxID=470076 RepID=UPI001E3D966E|nr:hypothetical protein [Mycobacterium stomatepiae]
MVSHPAGDSEHRVDDGTELPRVLNPPATQLGRIPRASWISRSPAPENPLPAIDAPG